MSPDEAPVGTVVVIGHPANGVSATKQTSGLWHYNHTWCDVVRNEDLERMARAVYIPGQAVSQ